MLRPFWLAPLLLLVASGDVRADQHPHSLAVHVVDAGGLPLPRRRVSLTRKARGDDVGYGHLRISAGEATFPAARRSRILLVGTRQFNGPLSHCLRAVGDSGINGTA
jgi:hypothetical protein